MSKTHKKLDVVLVPLMFQWNINSMDLVQKVIGYF